MFVTKSGYLYPFLRVSQILLFMVTPQINPQGHLSVPAAFTLENTTLRDMTPYLTQIELAKWLVVE